MSNKPKFPCPKCHSNNLIFYDTHENGNRGKYKCNNCGRDTIWAMGKSKSVTEILEDLKRKGQNNGIYS